MKSIRQHIYAPFRKEVLIGIVLVALTLISWMALSHVAHAAGNDSIITLPWSDQAKKPIPPTFILPEQARWGCLSCHSNPRLSKFRDGKEISLFIDSNIIGNSMHKRIACLDCHTNFSYDTHPASNPGDYRKVAGTACMKCHPYQAYLYKNSVHGKLALQNKLGKIKGSSVEPPLCSSCHGFHDIQSPRFEPYRSKFRASVRQGEVCAKCHQDRYQSYADYYHGKGYKAGATDAPVCWDCHDNHKILQAKDGQSTVNVANLPKTCDRCHDQPTQTFTSYASMIHGRANELSQNFVIRVISAIIPGIAPSSGSSAVAPASSAKPKLVASPGQSEGLLDRFYHFFFPSSLRPETP